MNEIKYHEYCEAFLSSVDMIGMLVHSLIYSLLWLFFMLILVNKCAHISDNNKLKNTCGISLNKVIQYTDNHKNVTHRYTKTHIILLLYGIIFISLLDTHIIIWCTHHVASLSNVTSSLCLKCLFSHLFIPWFLFIPLELW